ncbi:MAG TPA: nucleotidyltransferase family protein [Allosphingosinicella sp.]
MRDARRLVEALRDPQSVAGLPVRDWTALIALARAESLIGSLAYRLQGMELPAKVDWIMDDARRDAGQARRQALWEAEMARRALGSLEVPVILLKGTAYAAAGLQAGVGRSIGDLDIMVPRQSLDAVQEALLGAGWEWVKEDAYDDLYYRQWMHELPPLIHRERDRMIDVHHTILPLTHRRRPDAAAMVAESVVLDSGLRVLSPADMVVHSVAHLFADGDLAGGLRNLWDIDRMLREFASEAFWQKLDERARLHQLLPEVRRALRLSNRLYGTPVQDPVMAASDRLFERRLLARNGWGQTTRKGLRLAFYVRSHWLRMPPLMLARHLWTKARR